MPKKDTATAVLGMLSTAGAQTRAPINSEPRQSSKSTAAAPTVSSAPAAETVATAPAPEVDSASSGAVRALSTVRQSHATAEGSAPRTLRLRPDTAAQLRAAWLEAKRDDVLLTAQDFASNLVDEALARHRRRRASASS